MHSEVVESGLTSKCVPVDALGGFALAASDPQSFILS